MQEVKKAIILAAGLGTRFLPLTKALPKELLPLVSQPMISYAVREAKASGISSIVFVLSDRNKMILDFFKKDLRLEKILRKRNKKEILKELKRINEEFAEISFSSSWQPEPRGDGDALLRVRRGTGEPTAVLFPDDIVEAKTPAILQLAKIFRTSEKPVVGLKKVSKEKLPSYGVVEVEKIAHGLYKIKDIIEKPSLEEAPSDLAIVGRYILNSTAFDYLRKTGPNENGEIILAEALKKMLKDGKIVYGCELEGEWLECGNKAGWLKSNLYLCLKHPEFGPILREFLKKLK